MAAARQRPERGAAAQGHTVCLAPGTQSHGSQPHDPTGGFCGEGRHGVKASVGRGRRLLRPAPAALTCALPITECILVTHRPPGERGEGRVLHTSFTATRIHTCAYTFVV